MTKHHLNDTTKKTLGSQAPGHIVRFLTIEGGMRAAQRLQELGLLPGETIKVIDNAGHGPMTVSIKGAKIALGHGLANRIFVEELKHEQK